MKKIIIVSAFLSAVVSAGFWISDYHSVKGYSSQTVSELLTNNGFELSEPAKVSVPYMAAWKDFTGNAIVTVKGQGPKMIQFNLTWIGHEAHVEVPGQEVFKLSGL
jgi:hypothetical protein